MALPLLLCALPNVLSATTYYVATTGNDSNQGTQTSPVRHVSEGVARARAGDTVIVMDGTYDNEGKVSPSYVVNFSASGTASQPITVMAQNRGRAILDGGQTSTSSCNGAYAYFNLGNASYIVIQGFQIRNACDEGIHNNDSAHHITIRQNEIHHIANRTITDSIGRDGMYCNSVVHDIVFDANVIHDVGRSNAGYQYDHGLYAACSNLTVTNNVFYNQVSGWDVQLAQGANNVLIANNTFASHKPSGSGQIMVWAGHSGLTIRNNIFYNPPGYAITNYAESVSGCQIDTNIISGSAAAYSGGGCSIGSNKYNVNPMLTNPGAYDFSLQAGSPAINAGVSISGLTTDIMGTYRPQSGPIDIGAYQYSSGTSAGSGTSTGSGSGSTSGTSDSGTTSGSGSGSTSGSGTTSGSGSGSTVSTDGLAAWWKLNEGGGTTAGDASGNKATGTLVGGPAWVSGQYGTALSFNGTSSYITVPENTFLEQTSQLTVSFWISPAATSGDPRIATKSYSWDVKLNGTARRPQFSSNGKYAMLNTSLATNTWQHVVFTFSSGTVKGYVNGVAQSFAQNTFTGKETLPIMTYGFVIGADADKQNFAKGLIDGVRVYSRALSASEVSALYTSSER